MIKRRVLEPEALLVRMHSSVGLGLFMLVSLLPRAAKAFKSAAPRGVPRGMTSSLSSSASGGAGEAASGIVANANVVRAKIDARCAELGRDPKGVLLVPVSKTKPQENIMELYDAGWRHFGENYFQEILDKAAALPKDIQWHFIGHLQSGKANRLVRDVPNLSVIETVDTMKLASKLNNACELAERKEGLGIYLQVDTSGEDSKSGIGLGKELLDLADEIKTKCPLLRTAGLMTIGAPGDLTCFDKLVASRAALASHWGVPEESLALSMGMSGDFIEAVERGSTSVRVGSTIFGARDYPNKA